MIHVMADIETLGTNLIVSIGAVKFDGEQLYERFHVGLDPVDAERFGMVPDASTVLYWMDPKRDEARKQLLELPKVDVFAALDGFAMWIQQTPADQLGSLWGKGATFDNVKLKAAFDAVKLDYPFSYRQDECYRTLANRSPDIPYVQHGVAHDALADAESQAIHMQAICKARGLVL